MTTFKLKCAFVIFSGLVGTMPAIGQVADPQTVTVYTNLAEGMINSQTGEFYRRGDQYANWAVLPANWRWNP